MIGRDVRRLVPVPQVPAAPRGDDLDPVAAYLLGVLVEQQVGQVQTATGRRPADHELPALRAEARALFLHRAHTPAGASADIDRYRRIGGGAS